MSDADSYDIVHHQRNPKTGLSPESLRAVHPLAKAPTVEIQGTVMIESTAVILCSS